MIALDQEILIQIKQQQLLLVEKNKQIAKYPISTAAKGVGQQQGSMQTPLGDHYIRAKIGHGLALNTVLVGRRPTGEIYRPEWAEKYPNRDWILTRILWLSGCEKGLNRLGSVDSFRRYIYIHGTPDTEPMGCPKSHGCVRMRNDAIVELFDRISLGTRVRIVL